MWRALTGFAAAALTFLAPAAALAKKPVDYRADVGFDRGVALEKGGLTLSATCRARASGPVMRVFAMSEERAQLSASMTREGTGSPITVHEPGLRGGEEIQLLQTKNAAIGGTLSYTDRAGEQVSATFQGDAGDVLGGTHDCLLGGTSLKNTAIDYRADVGSKPRTLLTAGGVTLKGSCTGSKASPELDVALEGSESEEVAFGASWSQFGNASALTTFGSASGAPVDPLDGGEKAAAGTMALLGPGFDLAGTLVFHSDEGRGALRADCVFGATFSQPSEAVTGFVVSRGTGGSSVPLFSEAGFRGRSICPSTDSLLGLSSGVPDAEITASFSAVGSPVGQTLSDPDAGPGDPRLDVSASGAPAAGTAVLSRPGGQHASANFANVFVPGEGCLVFGTATAVD